MKMIGTVAILTMFLPVTARAAALLTTGPIQASTFICSAINVGTKPIKSITIEIVNSGTGAVLDTTTCSAVAPNVECVKALSTATTRAFCRISSSSTTKNVRGNLLSVLSGAVIVQDAR